MSDDLGAVFAALADPTRRLMVQALLRDGSTSAPTLSAGLPITRQAIAKHLATLEEARLLERVPSPGREVRYRLRGDALSQATTWLRDAEAGWERRLGRLKDTLEERRSAEP